MTQEKGALLDRVEKRTSEEREKKGGKAAKYKNPEKNRD